MCVFFILRWKKIPPAAPTDGKKEELATGVARPGAPPAPSPSPRSVARPPLLRGLEKFRTLPHKVPTERQWCEMEELLLSADVGVHTTALLLSRMKPIVKEVSELHEVLHDSVTRMLESLPRPRSGVFPRPYVISIVGINGVGKTTTIGKLAHRYRQEGKQVLLGATDTFRAGAIQQLKTWADRTGTQFVGGKEGGDPGAVAFDAVSAAKARSIDIVILDTAGRLHTKTPLMEELKKIHRVIKKVISEAPHETWLVLDAIIGQNSLQQAREFQKILELSGVIVTKLDGTAKGGALLGIASELGLAVPFIGVGEHLEDLIPFEPIRFVDTLLGEIRRIPS